MRSFSRRTTTRSGVSVKRCAESGALDRHGRGADGFREEVYRESLTAPQPTRPGGKYRERIHPPEPGHRMGPMIGGVAPPLGDAERQHRREVPGGMVTGTGEATASVRPAGPGQMP